MKTIYIHTIDGKPAYFSETNGQIVYAPRHGRAAEPAYSLKQIRREQKLTKEYREKRGYGYIQREYGYKRFRIDYQVLQPEES